MRYSTLNKTLDVFALISEQTKQAVQEMDRTAAAEKLRGALADCWEATMSTPDVLRVIAEWLDVRATDGHVVVPEMLQETAAGLRRVVSGVWDTDAPLEPEPIKVLAVVSGGCVTEIIATAPFEANVFDYDDIECGGQGLHGVQTRQIRPNHWHTVSHNPEAKMTVGV